MIIQHNLQAINANCMYGIITSRQSKSAEKLSSGYQINRAADDAAGLSISEKMRKQIRGLGRASTNSQDGISMVQTAEGALTEVHDMLHRMNELAVQAANGTNSITDRRSIQDEIDQLITEIDRVSETTKFNETYLLKGGSGERTKYLNIHDAGLKGIVNNSTDGATHGNFTMNRLKLSDKIMIGGNNYVIGTGKADIQRMINEEGEPGDTVDVLGNVYHIIGQADDAPFKQTSVINKTINENTSSVSIGTNQYALKSGSYIAEYSSTVAGQISSSTKSLTISGNTSNNSTNRTYELIDGNGNVAEKISNILNKVGSDVSSITFDSKTYTRNSSGNYVLSSDSSVIKTLNEIKSEVGQLTDGQSVSITKGSTTSGYKVRDYNYNDVKNYVSSAHVGQGTSSTTQVTINGSSGSKSYSLRNYNLNSVKNSVSNYTYKDNAEQGTLITVDGNSYTAETEFYRSAMCIAYGEDNETDVTKPGAGDDDLISANEVTFHGVTYSLMIDSDGDGYDDNDTSIITEGRAYKLIARELEKASNIGATETSAKVRDKNNAEIVDNVTMAADFLEDPDNTTSKVRFEIDRGTTKISKELSVAIHSGSDADMNNKIGINIEAMSAKNLGISNLNVVDDNGIGATYSLDAIEDAIKEVSRQRSELGAVQNRMEHTIRNLDNVVENTTASESRLRDTDMASEMVKYSINNILAQAGQSMLSQANQSTQGVMALLQG